MEASEIIRLEYGASRNFMTSDVLAYHRLPDGACELSEGRGIAGDPIYGVSVVRLRADGSTFRDIDASTMFHSRRAAESYIAELKGGQS